MDNILKKKTSARGSGGGGSVDSVYAQRANEKDTGHALFANDGCCKHTFHFGEESTRDTTVDSNVTCAYTWSMPNNERTPGCNADAARSPRKRLQRFCKRCVRKFSEQTWRSASDPRTLHREELERAQIMKQKASTETSRCSDRGKARRRNRMSTNARTAKRKRIASLARERFMSQGTAASSFVFEMATWYVRSPMLVPAVARRCIQRRRLEDYESNTRSLMGKLVQQPSGYRSDLQGPYRSTVRRTAKRIKQSISQAFGVGWMNLMGAWLT